MSDLTTIQVEKKLAGELKKSKRFKRQTYSELLRDMLRVYKDRKNQYDEFLHKIQQKRMGDLWDNREDEEWENA